MKRLLLIVPLLLPLTIQPKLRVSVSNTVAPYLIFKTKPVPSFDTEVLEPLKKQQADQKAQEAVEQPQVPQPVVPVYSSNISGLLAAIKMCESSGNYRATNGSHFGAYQFDIQTWNSVGGSARSGYDIMNSPPNEQDMRAQLLYNQRGTAPWEASRPCWG